LAWWRPLPFPGKSIAIYFKYLRFDFEKFATLPRLNSLYLLGISTPKFSFGEIYAF
jgi:hypothetical protein